MATIQMPDSKLLRDNSNGSAIAIKEPAKEVSKTKDPVAKGKMRKKTLAMKFADAFFEGSLNDAWDYMINDVAKPQLKNAIIKGIEVIFYGGVNSSSSGRPSSQTPYNSYYVGRDGTRRPANQSRRNDDGTELVKLKKSFDPKLIVVEDRGQAQRALADLRNDCNNYGQIGVDRLFELVGIDSDWTSTKYGWIKGDLDEAKVRPCGSGWWFDVPDPYPID